MNNTRLLEVYVYKDTSITNIPHLSYNALTL